MFCIELPPASSQVSPKYYNVFRAFKTSFVFWSGDLFFSLLNMCSNTSVPDPARAVSLACVMPLPSQSDRFSEITILQLFTWKIAPKQSFIYALFVCVCFMVFSVWGFPCWVSMDLNSQLSSAERGSCYVDAWLGSHVLCNQKSLHLKRKVFVLMIGF